jgi:hypothetical protein
MTSSRVVLASASNPARARFDTILTIAWTAATAMLGAASGATLASILVARRDTERSPMEGVVGDREEWLADGRRRSCSSLRTTAARRCERLVAGLESRVRSRA